MLISPPTQMLMMKRRRARQSALSRGKRSDAAAGTAGQVHAAHSFEVACTARYTVTSKNRKNNVTVYSELDVMMALQVGYFFRILFCVYGVPLHPNSFIAPDLRSKSGKIKYVASRNL